MVLYDVIKKIVRMVKCEDGACLFVMVTRSKHPWYKQKTRPPKQNKTKQKTNLHETDNP